MMKWMISLAAALAVGRIWIGLTVMPEPGLNNVDIFKDLAHVYIGALMCLACLQRQRWQWVLFAALIALEISVAILTRI